MRKLLLVSLAVLLALMPVLTASALIGPQYVNTANGKGVNLREGPSKDYAVIGSIPFGAMADSFDYYDGTWAYVSYNGRYGYAMARYFSSEPPQWRPTPTARPTRAPSGDTGMFNGFSQTNYYASVRPSTPSGYVNLRWAPSKNQPILNSYYSGYVLHVLQQNGSWAQVYDESSGICGFIMMSFLTPTGVGSSES